MSLTNKLKRSFGKRCSQRAFVIKGTCAFQAGGGAFWHASQVKKLVLRSNEAWWRVKLDGNMLCDDEKTELLFSHGSKVPRNWNHKEASGVVASVLRAISGMDVHNG